MRFVSVLAALHFAAAPLVAQPSPTTPAPVPTKSPLDSPEAEKFKKYLGTGGINRRPRVRPDLFLPAGNRRTSDAGAIRVYKTGPDGKVLSPQPKGFPHTVDPKTFQKAADELLRLHEGFDLSSRDAKGVKRSLDFKAGVYGRVVEVGTGNRIGRITVEVDERGNKVQYLHTSKTYVKIGDEVKPDTILGLTGKTGASEIHLHVQAHNAKDEPIDPDAVVLYARKPPTDRKMAEFFVPMKLPKSTPPISSSPPSPKSPPLP